VVTPCRAAGARIAGDNGGRAVPELAVRRCRACVLTRPAVEMIPTISTADVVKRFCYRITRYPAVSSASNLSMSKYVPSVPAGTSSSVLARKSSTSSRSSVKIALPLGA
jgi:hypothetical protein